MIRVRMEMVDQRVTVAVPGQVGQLDSQAFPEHLASLDNKEDRCV